ncbi:MAG: amidohydrolase [Candidatus Kapabacteria bacterium]|nr:amidohydrolase [Candidatus Kapabacteria bacterium]
MTLTNIKLEIEEGLIKSITTFPEGVCVVTGETGTVFRNAYILPGMTDSHCHLWGLGMMRKILTFDDCNSEKNCIEKAESQPFFRSNWIFGRGWNQENWKNSNLPTLEHLDKAFPDNPCYFIRVDGHAAWVNSKALEIAGISKETKDPVGGAILRYDDGTPNGVLVDSAMLLAEKLIPDFSEEQYQEFISIAQDLCIQVGITAVHDMDVSPKLVDIFRKMNSSNELKIRIYSHISAQNDEYIDAGITPYISDFFNVVGIKLFSDGALGSRGAALLSDYADEAGNKGLLILDKMQMAEKAEIAIQKGFDIAIHAIGDRANREVLDAYQILRQKFGNFRNKLRIEHAQIVAEEDIPRFRELNVIASVQPIHYIGDEKMALARLGREIFDKHGYPWQKFLKNGVEIIAGSDFPIESHNPFLGLSAFLTRQNLEGGEIQNPEERLNLFDAIKSYTLTPAKVVNSSTGLLRVGYKADFVITNSNIGSKSQIHETSVEAVYVGGNLKYSRS